jgi:hypothetical protein
MTAIKKSTDAGLSTAERKSLRVSEAQEAMSDHDDAQKAFQKNRERLREARLAREALAGPMLYPAPGPHRKPQTDSGLKIGDQVKLVPGTLAWKAEMMLQGKIGEVIECRDDCRVSIRFDNGRLLMGRTADQFEHRVDLPKAKGKWT